MKAKEDNLAAFESGIEQGLEIDVSTFLKHQSDVNEQEEKVFDIDAVLSAVVKMTREHCGDGTLVCVFNPKHTPKGTYKDVEFTTYNVPLDYVLCYFKDSQSTNDPAP